MRQHITSKQYLDFIGLSGGSREANGESIDFLFEILGFSNSVVLSELVITIGAMLGAIERNSASVAINCINRTWSIKAILVNGDELSVEDGELANALWKVILKLNELKGSK